MGIILGYYRDAYWSTSISECHKECVSWELGTSRSFTSWFCNWKNWHCDFKWKKLGRGCTLMNSDHMDGYMLFFLNLGYPSSFSHVVSPGWRGEASRKAHMLGGENRPFKFTRRLWAPTVDLRFCIHHCRLQQHEAMAKRGVWLWCGNPVFDPYLLLVHSWMLSPNTSKKHLLKKKLEEDLPQFCQKKSELYFWVSLVWLLLVVSLVTPKTHITLKKWWLADWQTTFALKSPFIFCFFFVGSFASFLKFTPTSQAPWQSNSWTRSVPIGRFSAGKKMGDMPACWEFRHAPTFRKAKETMWVFPKIVVPQNGWWK